MLEELKYAGAYVIDADKVGHKAYLPGTKCLEKLVKHFGRRILMSNGQVDRKVLGSIIFKDNKERETLNKIVWPAIKELMVKERDEVALEKSNIINTPRDPFMFNNLIVIEAAILIEAEWTDIVDEVWVVSAEESIRVERLINRNKFSKQEALNRIKAQMSNEDREKRAKVVLKNNSTALSLTKQVKNQLKDLKNRWKITRSSSQL